jgi:hypothetical protein
MKHSVLELAADEALVAEYAFPAGGSVGRRAVLTTKRLVVFDGTKRETHPLGRVRSVRVETGRNWFALLGLAAAAGVSLAVPLLVGQMRVALGGSGAPLDGVNEGYVISAVAVAIGLLCIWGVVVAYRGYIQLAIELESETKAYAVQGIDPKLTEFVTKVEHAL